MQGGGGLPIVQVLSTPAQIFDPDPALFEHMVLFDQGKGQANPQVVTRM